MDYRGMTSPEAGIKAEARRLGFGAVGITSTLPVGNSSFVMAWLDAKMHGEMGYLERRAKLRAGPLHAPELLAGAQSVVVVALSYDFADTPPPPSPRPRGVVARYARGDDYHPCLLGKAQPAGRLYRRNIARCCLAGVLPIAGHCASATLLPVPVWAGKASTPVLSRWIWATGSCWGHF